MPRKSLSCADCAEPMAASKGSLPQGLARCHSCRAVGRTCFVCGAPRSGKGGRRSCGDPECIRASRQEASARGNAPRFIGRPCQGGCGMVLGRSSSHYCEGCALVHSSRIAGVTHIACPVVIADCAHCAAPIVQRGKRRFCNDKECASDRARMAMNAGYQRYKPRLIEAAHRRRAQVLEQYVEDVSLDYLILRDKGRCHLCGIKVKLDGKRGPLMPSIDHVVPISKGGEHSLANTRLSHYRCNLSKGNRGGGEQLALVG